MDLLEPVRLIVWDLDEVFWRGTLTEGGIQAFVPEHHELVRTLARRGIMSSICSKNDREAVRAVLQEQGVWDCFVFPSVDWSPKGGRVAALVEAMGLRPPTVLFIDDNPSNRGEVAAASPGIVVAGEQFIPQIAAHPMFRGKDDPGLTRLAQYRLLERKKGDEAQAAGDNLGFLRACDIRVAIDYELERHLDRVVELISRTNQLNFTKSRLPEDADAARAAALAQIRYFGHQGGLVRVTDRYGDYGFVGFFLKTLDEGAASGTLKHFCFSCRTIGMGIEQYVYQSLGRPWLSVVGDVLSDVHNAPVVDWVNRPGDGAGSGRRLARFSEIRMRGGCEISALAHYFKRAGSVSVVETNFPRDNLVIKLDTASSLVNVLDADGARLAALSRLGFPPESLRSDFLAPGSGRVLLVLNLWGELHVPAQRHKAGGFHAHLVVDGFMGWEHGHPGGDLAAWTDAALAARADALGLDPGARARVFDLVSELRRDYQFVGPVMEAQVQADLRAVAARLPPGATLALLLPARTTADGAGNGRNADWHRWCTEALAGHPQVLLIDIDRSIHSPGEHVPGMGDHFDRIVFYRVAEDIMARVAAASHEPGGAAAAA